MKKLLFAMLASLLFSQAVDAQIKLETSDLTGTYKYSTSAVSAYGIHDPSVVWNPAEGNFYVYGSHYAAAKTANLRTWTGVHNYYKGGYNSANAYKAFQSNPTRTVKRTLKGVTEEVDFPSFDAAAWCATYHTNHTTDAGLSTAHTTTMAEWVSGDQWAPDIIYNPHMNKWCIYLSLNGDFWASAIVLMTSDNVEGPYENQGPVVMSGFIGSNNHKDNTKNIAPPSYKGSDLEIVMGSLSSLPAKYDKGASNGTFWPNCIDPCAFFDEEGELWLAYGSWSGGVFMLKLDKETGLRDYTYTYPNTQAGEANCTSDAYFGKKIAGGYYVSGEGPYIQHIGDYYYLFMSYGGYAPNEGYEMRIFRSESPTGPYTDANGTSAIYASAVKNYGADATTNRGMKIIGSYSGWGPQTIGQCSMGHNSACQDDLGRSYVVFHSKFDDGAVNAPHTMRTHQLFVNKYGWLCAAPFVFNGETATDATIAASQPWTATDIEGDYQVLIHPYKLNCTKYEMATPKTIHLAADGTVTGDYKGKWAYTDEGKSYFQITLNSVVYNGVVTEQTIQGSNTSYGITATTAKALCFTAVCSTKGNASCGVPVWGYKMQAPYAIAYNYQNNSDYFKTTRLSSVSKNVDIMFTPSDNVELAWTSSNPDILSNTGKFNPPAEETSITMTARLSSGNYYWEKEYSVKAKAATEVEGDQTTGLLAYYNFDENPTANLFNAEQTVTYARSAVSANATAPTLEEDYARFGQVVHQYFGAQGYNSYSRMPNPLMGQTDLEGFTVSLWVKRADANNWDALWSFFNSTSAKGTGTRLFLTGNSYLGFADTEGNWFDVNYPEQNDAHPSGKWKAVSKMGVGEWHLVTFTYSKESGYMLYLDGTSYLSSQLVYAGSAATAADFDRNLVLSHVTTAQYFFLGLGSFWGSAEADFDDLMIYNRALSATDVKGLYTLLNRVNNFDDGTITGIDDVEVAATSATVPSAKQGIFDLQGRRVAVPAKGLYIVNGKKMWLK